MYNVYYVKVNELYREEMSFLAQLDNELFFQYIFISNYNNKTVFGNLKIKINKENRNNIIFEINCKNFIYWCCPFIVCTVYPIFLLLIMSPKWSIFRAISFLSPSLLHSVFHLCFNLIRIYLPLVIICTLNLFSW